MKTKIKELKQQFKKHKVDIAEMDNTHCYFVMVDFRGKAKKGIKPTADDINAFMFSLKEKLKACNIDKTILIPVSDITPEISIFEINTKK